jgi:two-component system, OmpR family, sensor kinase
MKTPFRSIRWQIQIWYGLLLLAIVTVSGVIVHQLIWLHLLGDVDDEIRQNNSLLLSNLRRSALAELNMAALLRLMRAQSEAEVTSILLDRLESGDIDASANLPTSFSGRDPGFFYFKILDGDDRLVASSDNAPEHAEIPPVPATGASVSYRTEADRREQTIAEQSGFRLLVGRDLTPERAEMNRLAFWIVAGAGATWLAALAGGWLIAGYVIRPIRTISAAALRISRSNLKERIPLTTSGNELHDLAMVLNETFQRLEASFERQRQFTADASHELRTPVTVILSETQRMKKRPRTAQEYEEALEVCHLAGERMRKLVENLLLLARQDGENRGLELEHAQLDRLIRESVETHRVLARDKGIEIHSDLEPIFLQTDVLKLSILLNNLIGNAVCHQPGPGNVWVSTHRQAATIEITVRDDGPGIASEDLPHLFDRFYQADKARSLHPSHTGLGLAVSKAITDELGMKITVESEPGKGSAFTLTLSSG